MNVNPPLDQPHRAAVTASTAGNPYGGSNPYLAAHDILDDSLAGNFAPAGRESATSLPAGPAGRMAVVSVAPTAVATARPQNGNGASRAAGNGALRVLHVGPCFMNGGSEQHLIALATFLDPTRVRLESCLVTGRNQLDASAVARMPAPVAWADADAVRRAVSHCDVLFTWGLATDRLLGEIRPKLGIFLAHGETDWTRSTLLQSRRSVDHVIAVSQRVAQRVCEGFDHTVVLNGVDTTRLAVTRPREHVRARYGFSPDDFVLGTVCRLVPDKRVEALIETTARLPEACKLLVVGWGEHRAALLELANEHIPGRYAFASAIDHLGDLYGAMDAFALASAHEGFGLVVAEAMACGVPVIATRVGCVPEVVHDRVNGMIVDGDADSLTEAVMLVRAHPTWARAMALEGQAFAQQRLHASRMAREYEALLTRLWRNRHASEALR